MSTKRIFLATFYLIWLGLNGLKFNVLDIFFLFSVPIIVFFVLDKLELIPQAKNFHFLNFIGYFVWLIKEIIISSIAVSKIAWRPNLRIQPIMQPVISTQTTEIGIVVYANSITLTPGTVTLSVEGNMLMVHALDPAFMEGLMEEKMDRRVKNAIENC